MGCIFHSFVFHLTVFYSLHNPNISICTFSDIFILYYEKVLKNIVVNTRKNLLCPRNAVAEDETSGPRFLAAEASIFTSETPSITPFCFSSKNINIY